MPQGKSMPVHTKTNCNLWYDLAARLAKTNDMRLVGSVAGMAHAKLQNDQTMVNPHLWEYVVKRLTV